MSRRVYPIFYSYPMYVKQTRSDRPAYTFVYKIEISEKSIAKGANIRVIYFSRFHITLKYNL